jgi:Reverse transcriptase (RNA-dependent DNA polymerase)
LQSMYANVPLGVVSGDGVSGSVSASLGVKQGDPSSPTLFGLFIDAIEEFFAQHLPGVGVELHDTILQLLLYADDLVFFADCEEDAQRQLNVLSDFCTQFSLSVNVAKTEVMVFCPSEPHWRRVQQSGVHLMYRDVELPLVEQFRYLGCVLHAFRGWRCLMFMCGQFLPMVVVCGVCCCRYLVMIMVSLS